MGKASRWSLVNVFIITIALGVGQAHGASENVWTNLGLYGGQVYDIAIDPVDPDKMFAGIYLGAGLYVTRDGGASWQGVETNGALGGEDEFKAHAVYAVEIASGEPNIVWAAHNYWVEKSVDGGTTWTHITNSVLQQNAANGGGYYDGWRLCRCVAIDPSDSDTVYVGTTYNYWDSTGGGAVYKTTNGGVSWTKLNGGVDLNYSVMDIAIDPHDSSIVWAVTASNASGWGAGGLYRSEDGGETWEQINADNPSYPGIGAYYNIVLSPESNQTAITGCDYGIIRHTFDGENWLYAYAFPDTTFVLGMTAAPQDPDIIYAAWRRPVELGGDDVLKISRSEDGGLNWDITFSIDPALSDRFMALAVQPQDADRVVAGDKGTGISVTDNQGGTWTLMNEGLDGVTVYALAVDPREKTHMMAGTGAGLFERQGDSTWRRILPGIVKAVEFDAQTSDTYYAGVYNYVSYLAKSVDGGMEWTYSNPLSVTEDDVFISREVSHIAVNPSSTDTIYITAGETVQKSVDGGLTFASVMMGENQDGQSYRMNLVVLDPADPEHLFAGGGNFYIPLILGDLWESFDGGITWARTGLTDVIVNDLLIDPRDPRILYAGCGYSYNYYDILLKSTDGGGTWQVSEAGLPNRRTPLYSVWGNAPDNVFVVGVDGVIMHYDGNDVSAMSSGTQEIFYGVFGITGQDVFAVGTTGTIRHYDGNAWAPMSSGTVENLIDVWGDAADNVFAVGANGVILHYDGSDWRPMISGTDKHLEGVYGFSSSDVYAVGEGGTILHFDGMDWAPMVSGSTGYLMDVWGLAPDDLYSVGPESTILHFDGLQWTAMSAGGAGMYLNGIWGSGSDQVYAVGAYGAILHLVDGAWETVSVDDAILGREIWGTSATDMFISDQTGAIFHFNGSQITALREPGSSGRTIVDLAFHSQNPDIIYAATFQTGIFVSPNRAGQWLELGVPENSVFAIATGSLYAGTQGKLLQCTGAGVVTGQVTNAISGLGLHGATVTSDLGGAGQSVQGIYMMVSPAGVCSLSASADGYKDSTRTGIPVYGGDVSRVDFTLPIDAKIAETYPASGAPAGTVANDTSVAVRFEEPDGLDLTDPATLQFIINDGVTTYTRSLGDATIRFIKFDPAEADTHMTSGWIIYDRSRETADPVYPDGADVTVQVNISGTPPPPIQFTVETPSGAGSTSGNLPETEVLQPGDVLLQLSAAEGYDAGIRVVSGDLKGAVILYQQAFNRQPAFGPGTEMAQSPLENGIGHPLTLQPDGAFFDPPVTVFIPCPGYVDASSLEIHMYKNGQWLPACDAEGNVLPGGEGWMKPGSRVNHNNGNPSLIEIRIYHFSGVQAASPVPMFSTASEAATESGNRGSFCFIGALGDDRQEGGAFSEAGIFLLLLFLGGGITRFIARGRNTAGRAVPLLSLFLAVGIVVSPGPLEAATLFQQVGIAVSPNPVGSGARAMGMGGAFIGIADDATAASWNPAGLVQLEAPEVSIVGDIYDRRDTFSSALHPEIASTGKAQYGDLNYFSLSLPFHWGRNMVVSLNYQRLYDFRRELKYGYSYLPLGVDLFQNVAFLQEGYLSALGVAYAVELTPRFSLGVTCNFWTDDLWWDNGWQAVYAAHGAGTQGGAPVTTDTNISETYSKMNGVNANVGLMWNADDHITFGVVVKTPFEMQGRHAYHSLMRSSLSPASQFSLTEDVTIGMPLSYGAGMAWRFSDTFSIDLDLYRTHWSDYYLADSQGNRFSPVDGRLQSDADVGDTLQVRLGGEYLMLFPQHGIAVPLRAGIFQDPEPSYENSRDFFGITLGTGIAYKRWVVDVAYQLRWSRDADTGNMIAASTADSTQHSVWLSLICHL